MSTLFGFLLLASALGLLVGLMKPSWVKMPSRMRVIIYFGIGMILFLILAAFTSPTAMNVSPTPSKQPEAQEPTISEPPITPDIVEMQTQPPAPQPAPVIEATAPQKTQQPQNSNVNAQKELDDFFALAKKAGLVTSFEFSDSASVVYADKVWYTQKVSFKKDFLAQVALLKQAVTGYKHFEVRDAYSNEKVAEVTAFSGALEVYK